MLAALRRTLVELLGIASVPMLALAELNDAVIRVPLLGVFRNPDTPAFAVGFVGIEERAAEIFLTEDAPPDAGDPLGFRTLHLDETGFRPGLRASVRPAASPLGHAVAAAMAVALAGEAGGAVADPTGAWVGPPAPAPYPPGDFLAALVPAEPGGRFASVTDGAAALWSRRPAAGV